MKWLLVFLFIGVYAHKPAEASNSDVYLSRSHLAPTTRCEAKYGSGATDIEELTRMINVARRNLHDVMVKNNELKLFSETCKHESGRDIAAFLTNELAEYQYDRFCFTKEFLRAGKDRDTATSFGFYKRVEAYLQTCQDNLFEKHPGARGLIGISENIEADMLKSIQLSERKDLKHVFEELDRMPAYNQFMQCHEAARLSKGDIEQKDVLQASKFTGWRNYIAGHVRSKVDILTDAVKCDKQAGFFDVVKEYREKYGCQDTGFDEHGNRVEQETLQECTERYESEAQDFCNDETDPFKELNEKYFNKKTEDSIPKVCTASLERSKQACGYASNKDSDKEYTGLLGNFATDLFSGVVGLQAFKGDPKACEAHRLSKHIPRLSEELTSKCSEELVSQCKEGCDKRVQDFITDFRNVFFYESRVEGEESQNPMVNLVKSFQNQEEGQQNSQCENLRKSYEELDASFQKTQLEGVSKLALTDVFNSVIDTETDIENQTLPNAENFIKCQEELDKLATTVSEKPEKALNHLQNLCHAAKKAKAPDQAKASAASNDDGQIGSLGALTVKENPNLQTFATNSDPIPAPPEYPGIENDLDTPEGSGWSSGGGAGAGSSGGGAGAGLGSLAGSSASGGEDGDYGDYGFGDSYRPSRFPSSYTGGGSGRMGNSSDRDRRTPYLARLKQGLNNRIKNSGKSKGAGRSTNAIGAKYDNIFHQLSKDVRGYFKTVLKVDLGV